MTKLLREFRIEPNAYCRVTRRLGPKFGKFGERQMTTTEEPGERETLVAAIGELHPRHLDAALASPHIARRSARSHPGFAP